MDKFQSMSDVGAAVDGTGSTVPEEVKKSPKFQAMKQWIQQPENFATAMVLIGGMLQPQDRGKSTSATVAQRLLGAGAFRGNLQEQMDQNQTEDQKFALETEYRQGQLGIGKEQVAATRENTAADRETSLANTEALARANANNDATRRYVEEQGNLTQMRIAEMNASTQRAVADIGANAKQPGIGLDYHDFDTARQMVADSAMSSDPRQRLTYEQALLMILRGKMIGVPGAVSLGGASGGTVGAPPAAAAPVQPAQPKAAPVKRPANYSPIVDPAKVDALNALDPAVLGAGVGGVLNQLGDSAYRGSKYNPGQ